MQWDQESKLERLGYPDYNHRGSKASFSASRMLGHSETRHREREREKEKKIKRKGKRKRERERRERANTK